jgi:hypothetical protein
MTFNKLADGDAILDYLRQVARERQVRAVDAELQARVLAVKQFQHQRFQRTYVDLLAQTRYARATRFFLDDLYGPHDFTERDAQFARIVPALVRLFPRDIVTTVRSLGELHAMSEILDTAMATHLAATTVDLPAYKVAWIQTGQPQSRQRQIDLMLIVGRALERYTHHPFLRHSLRAMRAPARAAGLASLQQFLESGFDTFRELGDAGPFLKTIAEREEALARWLFGSSPDDLDPPLPV